MTEEDHCSYFVQFFIDVVMVRLYIPIYIGIKNVEEENDQILNDSKNKCQTTTKARSTHASK